MLYASISEEGMATLPIALVQRLAAANRTGHRIDFSIAAHEWSGAKSLSGCSLNGRAPLTRKWSSGLVLCARNRS